MALTYNGIAFVYPLTTTHVNGPVKDPSGTDQLFTEITISAESLLNAKLLPANITQDANPAQVLDRVRHYLTQPRGALYYDLTSLPGQTGNSPVIDIPDGRDDGTGPWPDEKGFSIKYTTPGTLLVSWSCTVRLRDCGNPAAATEPLSLRWVDSLSWDAGWKAVYTRQGTVILSSKSTRNADWYRRNRLAPPVPYGFKRTSSKYTISSDFLRCDFTMTDEQIRFAPPGAASTLSIVQSESAPLGPIRKGAVSVSLDGLQNSNVVDLARWALIILAARVQAAGPLVAGVGASTALLGVINLETKENEGSVSVTASCSYKTDPNKARTVALVGSAAAQWAAARSLPQQASAGTRKTPQGLTPGLSKFPWVGSGTSPASVTNPGGYAGWANPSAAMGGPADGVGLAQAVSLFAAVLRDPCGTTDLASPNAAAFTPELRTKPSEWNTLTGGGQGGTSPTATSQTQIAVSLSSIASPAYPATVTIDDANGLWEQDGQPGVYDLWQTNDEYVEDGGTMVVPVCNSSPGAVNVQIGYSSVMFSLYRRWIARRSGAPPKLPPKTVNLPSGEADPNWVYVGGAPAPALRELDVGSDNVNIAYEASGVYIFQALDASKVSPTAPIPPFMNPVVGKLVASWYNEYQLVATQTASGSSPLGSNSLTG